MKDLHVRTKICWTEQSHLSFFFSGFRSGTTRALDIQDTMLMMYIKMFWGKHIAIYICILDDVDNCVLILDMMQVCSGE